MIHHTKNDLNKYLLSLDLIDYNIPDDKKIKLLYTLSNSIYKNYRVYKIKKKNGGYRTIYSPSPSLKKVERKILENILNYKKISKYAKAYKKGISLKDNALAHQNKKLILKLDIIDFFENINYFNIYATCFNEFPKEIGHLLTNICTYESRLPQGSPASSYISNLVMKSFDEEIGSWCEEKNISYTRYSDDMTFSGDINPSEIIKKVRKKLYTLDLKLNNRKINVISHSNQQKVTGLVVNKKVNVPRKYRDKIRQEIYYIKKFGLHEHLIKIDYPYSQSQYLKSLYGRILYVLSINKNNKEFNNYKAFVTHWIKI